MDMRLDIRKDREQKEWQRARHGNYPKTNVTFPITRSNEEATETENPSEIH